MDEIIRISAQESEQESDKPPSTMPRPARPWRVAVIANIKGESTVPSNAPADAGAEFDREETIQSILESIQSEGHTPVFIPADSRLPAALMDLYPDICFNIAEGLDGDAREAQVPALLELMHIPYTASRVLTNAVSLDKVMTKRIWRDMGLPTAQFQEFVSGHEPLNRRMIFPMFVKPAREGTGMGMDSGSIVRDETELRQRVNWVIGTYHQPALVEEYLPGREFTVAVMGRADARLYSRKPELYKEDGFHRFPILEIDSNISVTPGVYGHGAKSKDIGADGAPEYLCPANIPASLAKTLNELAIAAHKGINAVDISRVDIRLDAQGRPRLLEINTLPGLNPLVSDVCIMAKAEGLSYQDLILEILNLGASRFGILQSSSGNPIEVPELVPARSRLQ
jgi:D-alanine-D-alanine ligase